METGKYINTMEYKQIKPSIYNYQVWIDLTDPTKLYQTLDLVLRESGYTILNHIEHFFPVQGYTCLWLLAESHLAVHTFPESNRSYVELSGCNEAMSQYFITLFEKQFTIIEETK